MADAFAYDVFLSYSAKDREIVRPIAERLRSDGLRVWFSDWAIKPRTAKAVRSKKLEEGLEHSRALVFCMSASAFGAEWTPLEACTFRFRDPLNKDRRFIPLLLDDSPIPATLRFFAHINWTSADSEHGYQRLVEACWTRSRLNEALESALPRFEQRAISLGHTLAISSLAFGPNGTHALSGSWDETARIWDLNSGNCVRVLEGHSSYVSSVAWSADGRLALTGSGDKTARIWDFNSGNCIRVLEGHSGDVNGVTCSADVRLALSGSGDKTARIWDVNSGKCIQVLDGHSDSVNGVAWSADGRLVLSGSIDHTARIWGVSSGKCIRVLESHSDSVTSLAWSADGHLALSGSDDQTARIWDVNSGNCIRVLEGHSNSVNSVAWSADGRFAVSGSRDKSVRIWDVDSGKCIRVLEGHSSNVICVAWRGDVAFSGAITGVMRVWDVNDLASTPIAGITPREPDASTPEQVQYTNAKVLLVGDPGVGKTGLANYLALGIKDDERKTSTDGAWATHWPLPRSADRGEIEREIWIWDFAWQVDYRLVQQLFMDETAVAVLVFDPQIENPFESLGRWDLDLQKATRKPLAKLLSAGRVDCRERKVSRASMNRFADERGFQRPIYETSAKTGEGCDALRDAIVQAIGWQNIPTTTSPALYHRMKQEIVRLRNSGLVLIRLSELKQRMELALAGVSFTLAELETVVGLLAGPGMIQRLDFGAFILLRPEVLSRYAAAVVREVRKHPQELGCIREAKLLAGDLDYQDFTRLSTEDEAVVLRALVEKFISRAWCLRQPHGDTALLTFPSYFRLERDKLPGHPSVQVTYHFSGQIDDIYAALVVRLHYTEAFESVEFWKFAADFKTPTGQTLGLMVTREAEATARLEVYFDPDVEMNSRVLFLRYIHNHLSEHAQNVVRLRHYACGRKKCARPFTDRELIDEALAPGGSSKVFCPKCRTAILLRDLMEKKFESPEVEKKVLTEEQESQSGLDNEGRELVAVHHMGFVVAEAGQIYRGYTNSDHGIDGEIEFKDDRGRATGKRLYVQLKSGDSYLKTRQRDNAEVFQIKKARWADYWQQQAYPVMLVIRQSDGKIRWMEITSYLKSRSGNGSEPVKQIVFNGETLDVMSVRRCAKRS